MSKTSGSIKPIKGDKPRPPSQTELAKECLYQLVRYIYENKDSDLSGIAYSELAGKIGKIDKYGDGFGRGMGKILSIAGHMLLKIEGIWGEPVPYIASLIISKISGMPSDGMKEFWPEYPQLNWQEKRNKIAKEYERIQQFGSRWNDVLKQLQLPSIEEVEAAPSNRSIRCGGESDAHKALKQKIIDNPELVGANKLFEAFPEYSLPSGDSIDVLFKSCEQIIAVEVKSKISDRMLDDYQRGIYQTVKYQAVLEAMTIDSNYKICSTIKTILVLESPIPKKYKYLAERFGTNIIVLSS